MDDAKKVDATLAGLRAALLAAARWDVTASRPCEQVADDHGLLTSVPGAVETWTIQIQHRTAEPTAVVG